MADIKDRAREYLAEHSKYSEVFGQTFVAVDTLTAMVEFAKQETKELEAQIEKMKCCSMCKYYSMSFLPYWCTKNNTAPHCTSKCDKWEIAE